MTQKLKTALYGRTSNHDRKKVTIEAQQKALREWAVRDNLVGEIAGEFWDGGISGKIPLWERPAGKKMMEAIDNGGVQAVACLYLDRFGRTLLDSLQAAAKLEEKGVKLVATADGYDARREDNPLYYHIRAAIAEDEHRRIRQRMERGKALAIERDGQPPCGTLVFGYRFGPRNSWVVDPIESAVVQHVFRMADDGASNADILRWLAACGVPAGRRWQKKSGDKRIASTHEGCRWHLTRVVKMLRRREYIGERVYDGTVYPCPAIIDRDLWDRVQLRCDKYKARKSCRYAGMLSGILRCSECKGTFHHDGNKGCRRAYRCVGRYRGRGPCKMRRVFVDEADGIVWDAVRDYLSSPEKIIREATARRGESEDSLAAIEREQQTLDAAMKEIEAEVAQVNAEQEKGDLPFSWVLPRLNTLNRKRTKLVEKQEDLRKRRAAVNLDTASIERAVMFATIDVMSGLVFTNADEKRRIIHKHVAVVEVFHDHLAIEFKWGAVANFPIPWSGEVCYGTLRISRLLPLRTLHVLR